MVSAGPAASGSRPVTVARRRWRRVVVVCSCALLTGCASAIPVSFPRATGLNTSCIAPAPAGDLLLGVALSGGGSRAAVFGAASLQALGRHAAAGHCGIGCIAAGLTADEPCGQCHAKGQRKPERLHHGSRCHGVVPFSSCGESGHQAGFRSLAAMPSRCSLKTW